MKKKIKKILLAGFGAEIGSMLLSMNDPKKDGLLIDTVITRPISDSKKHTQLESLYARLVLNDPTILPYLEIDEKNQIIKIKGRKIRVFLGDIAEFDFKKMKKKFDATIVATSKAHINNKKIMENFLQVSGFVFGVAESKYFPESAILPFRNDFEIALEI